MRNPLRPRGRGPGRRGAVLVVALVLMILVSAMLTAMTRIGLVSRQRQVLAERRAQAEWLAASGLERAAARLRGDPGYDGEDWAIPADDLGGRHEAVVRITVKPAEASDSMRRATARAELCLGPDRRVTRTLSALVAIESQTTSDDASINDNTNTQTDTGPNTAPEEVR